MNANYLRLHTSHCALRQASGCLPRAHTILGIALVLFFLLPSVVSAEGDGCVQSGCNPGDFRALEINCANNDNWVKRVVCGGEGTEAASPFLRIAVRCYDNGETFQARYTDRVGFPPIGLEVSFDDLTDGCDNYIAAASLGQFQAQCFKASNNPDIVVPDCEPQALGDLDAVLGRTRLYSAILPTAAENTCLQFGDVSLVELRNSSFDYAYQGVMAGRYVCTQTDNQINGIVPCDGPPNSTRPPLGMYGKVGGFNLAPQSQTSFNVNPSVGFNFCCDNDTVGEGDCIAGQQTADCSPADIQCTNAVVFSICRDGELLCQDPANFVTLNPVIWLDPVLDVDPGDNTTVTPSSFSNACFGFDFMTTLGSEQERKEHTFGGAFRGAPVCVATGFRTDIDFDGIYDVCDPVLQETGPSDGHHRIRLRNKLRNEVFFSSSGFAMSDDVSIGPENGTILEVIDGADPLGIKDELVVEVPRLTASQADNASIVWTDGGSSQAAPQTFQFRTYGYASVDVASGSGRILAFDQLAERSVDVNSSPTNSYVDLECEAPSIVEVGPPVDMDTRSVATGSGHFADREVFFASDVLLDTNVLESRLFGVDIQNHRLLHPSGVTLPGPGRALDVELDSTGQARAYVARKEGEFLGRLAVVNVDPGSVEPLWNLIDSPLLLPGVPAGILVYSFGTPGNPDVRAYVTSVECSPGGGLGPMQMGGPIHCIECGGGGGSWRKLHLAVVDVTDPNAMQVREAHEISSQSVPLCNSSTILPNVGMAMTISEPRMLFVANPDQGRVEVLDTATDALLAPIALSGTMPVPVDIAVVEQAGPFGIEAAYVVDSQNQNLRVIDVLTLQQVDIVPLVDPAFPDPQPVAVAAMSDGTRLFTADSLSGGLSVINIKSDDEDFHKRIGTIAAGGDVRRIVLLALPE